MAEGLGEHTTPTEDLGWVPSVHIRHLITACLSGSWGCDAVLLSLRNLYSHAHTCPTQTQAYLEILFFKGNLMIFVSFPFNMSHK